MGATDLAGRDGGRGLRGIRTAREVLAVADPLAGSPMESVLRWMIQEAGLPAPELQHAVLGSRGEFIGRVDLAGWLVLRFTSADLRGRPEWVLATIRRAPTGR